MAVEITLSRNTSIFDSIKQMLGVDLDIEDVSFDQELMMTINAAFGTLGQIGVGSFDSQFRITGSSETWGDFIGDQDNIDTVIEYVFVRTKLVFDPPQSSFVLEELKKIKEEDEFRLSIATDPGEPLGV